MCTVRWITSIKSLSFRLMTSSARPKNCPNKYTVHVTKRATVPPAATAAHQTLNSVRLRLKRDGGHAETRLRLSAKRTSPFNP